MLDLKNVVPGASIGDMKTMMLALLGGKMIRLDANLTYKAKST